MKMMIEKAASFLYNQIPNKVSIERRHYMNRRNIVLKRTSVKNVVVIGVDVGKFWHFTCAFLPSGEFTKPFKFFNNAYGFAEFIGFITRLKSTLQRDVIVGIESTGHYWENLAYFLDSKGVKLVQVNPAHTKKSKELLDNTPNKADPKDSIVIADLVAQGKFLSLILPKGDYAELRMLTKARARVVKELTSLANAINYIIDMVFPELTQIFPDVTSKTVLYLLSNYPRPSDLLTISLEELTKQLRKVSRGQARKEKIEQLYKAASNSVGITQGNEQVALILEPYLSKVQALTNYELKLEKVITGIVARLPETKYLLSMKGIGVITVATMLGETGDLRLYNNAWEVIKLAGLNLYRLSSGKYQGQVKITKRGRPLLRWIFFFAALRQARLGMPLYNFYWRLRNNGVHKMKALIAVARKLLCIMFALVRDRREYVLEGSTSLAA